MKTHLMAMIDANGNIDPSTARSISEEDWKEQSKTLQDHGYRRFDEAERTPDPEPPPPVEGAPQS